MAFLVLSNQIDCQHKSGEYNKMERIDFSKKLLKGGAVSSVTAWVVGLGCVVAPAWVVGDCAMTP